MITMLPLTKAERKALLLLFRDFDTLYNANSMSKVLGMSHVGAQKLLRRLKNEQLVEARTIGKAITYTLNREDEYVQNLISFLLADEANNQKRWKEEFKGAFKEDRIVLLFGSAIENYKAAKDIDLMIVARRDEEKKIGAYLKDKQRVLPKKLHSIVLTKDDMSNSIKNKENAMIDIMKKGVVLYGQDHYVRLVKNVTSK